MTQNTASTGHYRPIADRIARGLRRPAVPMQAFALLALGLDIFALTVAFWFAAYFTAGQEFHDLAVLITAGGTALCTGLSLWAGGAYRLPMLHDGMRSAMLAWCVALGWTFARVALSLGPPPCPSYWICAAGLVAGAMLGSHFITGVVSRWARDFGLSDRITVLIGGGKEAEAVLDLLQTNKLHDLRVVGLFDDRVDDRSPDVVMGVPKLGAISDLIPFARQAQIDSVVIAFPLTAHGRIHDIATLLRVLPVNVHLSGLASAVSDKPELITLSQRPMSGGSALAKRALDIAVALVALLLLAPVLVAVALLVKLTSRGPVFFHQKRHGYNNTEIEILKFRSMYVDQSDRTARRVVGKGDPRVTPVGRIIRRWSLDELPQLINVLRGDLSLVGPRPHVVDAVYSETTPFEELVDGYAARHRVPPGITGWAQINGWRGEIDDPERLLRRVEHDLYYIENSTLWFDLWILLRTIPSLFNTKYAY